ncbi:MAG: 16S rRNA (uracil(1498)-N(3))-methyltransferase [Microcoleaceae cyanobacterium]
MVQLQRLAITPAQIQGQQLSLTLEQQHYLGRVLRLQKGDRFVVFDGQVQTWTAQLVTFLPADPPQAELLESSINQTELPVSVTLLVALPKGNGFDQIVRCCTELGTNRFVPVLSDRTLLKPSENKLDRWRKIATEAAEQSERQQIPTISQPLPLTTALQEFQDQHSLNCFCVARQPAPHLLTLLNQSSQFKAATLATGPEGGWTSEEVALALEMGFQSVSLGNQILRAITAPIAALSIVSASLTAA